MGLPLWRDYKDEEQKADSRDALKNDPTAAARSSIRRRTQRRRDVNNFPPLISTFSLNQPQEQPQASRRDGEAFSERAVFTAGGDNSQVLPIAPVAPELSQSERARLARLVHYRRTAGRRAHEVYEQRQGLEGTMQRLNTDLESRTTAVPPLRREMTRSSGFPGPEARPATLPTPPLESDAIGSAPSRTLPIPPGLRSQLEATHDRATSGDVFHLPRMRTDGLGDRTRSISPEENAGDHWEIIRTTIPEDDSLASTESSFAGAAAADSLTSTGTGVTLTFDSQPTDSTSATDVTGDGSHEPHLEDCMPEWDFYSDNESGDDVEPALIDVQANTTVPESSFADQDRFEDDDHQTLARMRREYNRLEMRLDMLTAQYERNFRMRNRENDTGTPSPGSQRPDRYGAEVLQRSRDAVREAQSFFRQASDALGQGVRASASARSTSTIRPSQIADTRSDMQSSADLLGTFSESLRHDDNNLETMRGIVQRMVAREDIPDDFWLSAGLSRDAIRASNSAAERAHRDANLRSRRDQ